MLYALAVFSAVVSILIVSSLIGRFIFVVMELACGFSPLSIQRRNATFGERTVETILFAFWPFWVVVIVFVLIMEIN